MPTEHYGNNANLDDRSVPVAVMRGLASKCPSCGKGSVFNGFLTIADRCNHCDEDLHHHRADDFPAYLNILIVGHVLIGAAVFFLSFMEMWHTVILVCALALVMSLALMRPLKGMVVAIQWAMRMHGFGGDHD